MDFILQHGFKNLAVSIDGATEPTVQHTRTASLSKIMANVESLIETSAKRGCALPRIIAELHRQPEKHRRVDGAGATGGATRFQAGLCGVVQDFCAGFARRVAVSDAGMARREFLAAQELGGKRGIDVIIPPEFGATLTCNQPFGVILMKWDGRMRSVAAPQSSPVPPLYIEAGNVYETAVEELWNGELAQKVRLGLLGKGETHPICACCAYTGFNLDRYTRYLGARIKIKGQTRRETISATNNSSGVDGSSSRP